MNSNPEVLLHFPRNWHACPSWIALVKPINVRLFHFLVIFVSNQHYNQDKHKNVTSLL